MAEDNDKPPPGAMIAHPATLQAFEDVVLTELASLTEQEKQDRKHMAEQERQKQAMRDRVDILMISLGFLITAVLIWLHCENWAPETGPIPIAGVALRRMFNI
jgi:hypothetical protein